MGYRWWHPKLPLRGPLATRPPFPYGELQMIGLRRTQHRRHHCHARIALILVRMADSQMRDGLQADGVELGRGTFGRHVDEIERGKIAPWQTQKSRIKPHANERKGNVESRQRRKPNEEREPAKSCPSEVKRQESVARQICPRRWLTNRPLLEHPTRTTPYYSSLPSPPFQPHRFVLLCPSI